MSQLTGDQIKEFSRLSPDEEATLEGYRGQRRERYDGKGNLVSVLDTRTPVEEALVTKKFLKVNIARKYSSQYPQRKLDAARNNTLTDSKERDEILAFNEEVQREYTLRKEMMNKFRDEALAAQDKGDISTMRTKMDMMQEVALSPAWMVTDHPNYLTLGLTKQYKLEKVV